MEPVRLGLVGLGGMGQHHLKVLDELTDSVRLVAVADVNPAAVDKVVAEKGVRGFATHDELIKRGNCEAILIAAPHPFHPAIAIAAAKRGLHVLSEKPIAIAVAEGERMVEAARRAGVLLGVMFQIRTNPVYRRAKEIIDAGTIGEIYRTTLVANHWYRTQAYYDSGAWRGTWKGEGGGVLMNQAPHSLDLLIWLGGLPSRVSASVATRGHRIEVEDTAEALLEYGGGKTGYFYTTTAEWPGEDRYEFVGDRGKLVVADGKIRLYSLERQLHDTIQNAAETWERPQGEWQDIAVPDARHGHAVVTEQFVRAIRLGEPLVATGEDGLRQLELANAILLSGNEGRPIEIPVNRRAYGRFLTGKQSPPA